MGSLRTPEGLRKYEEYLAHTDLSDCPLCGKEPIETFQFWKVIENSFPYDLIAKVHHMLIPKRHASEHELSPEELEELAMIRQSFVHPNYEWIIEATHQSKSIPSHFHIHLLVGK
jgi:diadenosine tetraphosphate (Ap4A) HIT family hydrolase